MLQSVPESLDCRLSTIQRWFFWLRPLLGTSAAPENLAGHPASYLHTLGQFAYVRFRWLVPPETGTLLRNCRSPFNVAQSWPRRAPQNTYTHIHTHSLTGTSIACAIITAMTPHNTIISPFGERTRIAHGEGTGSDCFVGCLASGNHRARPPKPPIV